MLLFALSSSFKVASGRSARAGSLARMLSMSGGGMGMPADDAQKPFYALGVNVAKQVGGELKGILDAGEIDAMLAGFTDR